MRCTHSCRGDTSWKELALWRGRLATPTRHERFRRESVELRKPCSDIHEHRLNEDAAAGPAHPNAVTFKSELAGKAHRLASAVSEKLGCCGHRDCSKTGGLYHEYIPACLSASRSSSTGPV